MSDAFENWQLEKKVIITAEVYPDEGYVFSDSVQFSCGSAAIQGQPEKLLDSGFRIKLLYYSLIKLKKPENVYIDENDRLKWDVSDYSGKYRIRFFCGWDIIAVINLI